MIIYYGEEDSVTRNVKIEALKKHFGENGIAKEMRSLKSDSLAGGNEKEKETLVINAHGNTDAFSGKDAETLFNELLSKGLTNKRFESIYLMACNVGEQAQDNSILHNFAKAFDGKVRFHANTKGIKVYAPRGILRYDIYTEKAENPLLTLWRVRRVYIVGDKGEEYSLKEGLLLVSM
ncbi:MAG TPA: hypothetical protein VJZ77_16355 [Blastocatellia bacterium]|jgi:hypothetical protein|nr:hypothetical protein [Blastocatellia bacterium]